MSYQKSLPPLPNGGAAAVMAEAPGHFINQHIYPLFIKHTVTRSTEQDGPDITSEEEFWGENRLVVFGAVRLKQFRLSDWFPRTPGVFWSRHANAARSEVLRAYDQCARSDDKLGSYYLPSTKRLLVEDAGIGTIRLRPRKIDGEDCWLATALSGTECHRGIPLAIPNAVLRAANVRWGDEVNILGRVRFLQDAGLVDIACGVHHSQPLLVFVDEIEGVSTRRFTEPITITPVALFFKETDSQAEEMIPSHGSGPRYTFVTCEAGSNSAVDEAADWIDRYAKKHDGRVITNFDEQRPVFADAPLSYQRLVAKTYDRTIIQRFEGSIHVEHIDRLVQGPVITQQIGEIHMGHKIKVGGAAIINIDSVLSNVTQTIGSSSGLNLAQKAELEKLVQSLKADLDKLQAIHPDETKEIATALEKAVANATKPPEQRKTSILELSAKGLKEAAELVKDIAPTVLTTAGMIAKFIVGL